jgi:hypothetical protein
MLALGAGRFCVALTKGYVRGKLENSRTPAEEFVYP